MRRCWVIVVVLGTLLVPTSEARAEDCTYYPDPNGDATLVHGTASLANQTLPAVLAASDKQADMRGVCASLHDPATPTEATARFDVVSAARPAGFLGRKFTAVFLNVYPCFELHLSYDRGAVADTARAVAFVPNSCEPFLGLHTRVDISGAIPSNPHRREFMVSVPMAAIAGAVAPVLDVAPADLQLSLIFNYGLSALGTGDGPLNQGFDVDHPTIDYCAGEEL